MLDLSRTRSRGPAPAVLRRRIEAAVERLIAALDALDGDPDLEDSHDAEDDPAEWGIADADGYVEQFVGEATGTFDDIVSQKSAEAWRADREAAGAAARQAQEIRQRKNLAAFASAS